MAGRVMDYVTLGILLFAATFAVLALNFTWAKVDADAGGDEFSVGYRPLAVGLGDDDTKSSTSYSSEGFDDADGVGMVRTGGVLFLIGTLLAGLAALLGEHKLLLQRNWLGPATAVVALLAAGLLATAVVLLPIGMKELVQEGPLAQFGDDITWSFGLYAGVVAGAAAIAATVTSAITTFREGGFRLELADAGAADFDA